MPTLRSSVLTYDDPDADIRRGYVEVQPALLAHIKELWRRHDKDTQRISFTPMAVAHMAHDLHRATELLLAMAERIDELEQDRS
jgi:hypothetical protein